MSETVTNYHFVDIADGEHIHVRYTHRACFCMSDCYDDTIEIADPDGNYKMDIEGGDMKLLIQGLLNGTYKKVKND